MSQNLLYQWTQTIATHFSCLFKPQQKVLALASFALVLAKECTLSAMAQQLMGISGTFPTVYRRLQRFLSSDRIDMRAAQMALACWVFGSRRYLRRLVLLVDETCLGEHLRVMVVCMAYEGRAIPVAWRCYAPNDYPEEGQLELVWGLLCQVWECVPARCQVLVQADRGIGCNAALLERIASLGWYYLVRVQGQVRLRLSDGKEVRFDSVVKRGGRWSKEVEALKKGGWLRCRALAWWEGEASEPWLLLTNHPRVVARAYAKRMWEELAFRDFKSGGWQWQRSRVREACRAERLWLVMSVAYAWMVSVGSWCVCYWARLRSLVGYRSGEYSVFQLGLRLWSYWLNRGVAEFVGLWLGCRSQMDRGWVEVCRR